MDFQQIDLLIINENLTENELRKMARRVSAMPAGPEKFKLFIIGAKHPNAPTVLIKKMIDSISREINNINIDEKNEYLTTLNKIYISKLLANRDLTENDLKIIFIKRVLTIPKECGKYECSIIIAKHPNASLKLKRKIISMIFREVHDTNKINEYFDSLISGGITRNDSRIIFETVSTIIPEECGRKTFLLKSQHTQMFP